MPSGLGRLALPAGGTCEALLFALRRLLLELSGFVRARAATLDIQLHGARSAVAHLSLQLVTCRAMPRTWSACAIG
jgi:hypothetical protein